MQLLDGRGLAAKIRQAVKEEITRRGITPGLAVILIGDNPASHLYVSLKEEAAREAGIKFEKYVFTGIEPESEVLAQIRELNAREDIHGILVQVPLPSGYNEDIIINPIDPKKDVDGFTQVNLRAIIASQPRIFPAVALAIVALVDEACMMITRSAGLQPRSGDAKASHYEKLFAESLLQNKKVVLVVNRTEFAAPIEYLLEKRGALTHIILRQKEMTADAIAQVQNADVLVVARGHANFIRGEMFKDGAIVIDVGINKLPDGRMVGDVDFDSTQNVRGFITPVPGGVGPMTVAMLLKNTLELAKHSL